MAPKRTVDQHRRFRQFIEFLENRRLLSVDPYDPTFGNNGVAILGAPQSAISFHDVATLSDGRILGAPGTFASFGHFPLARLTATGQLDTSFGDNGWAPVNPDPSRRFTNVAAIAILPDGGIAAFGTDTAGPDANFMLAKYTANGLPDTSFAISGVAITNTPFAPPGGTSSAQAASMAIQDNGDIVVAGTSSAYWTLARYLPNGTLDTTFGDHGLVNGGTAGVVYAMDIEPDGTIVMAGYSTTATGHARMTVMRFLDNGSPDTTFGVNGSVVLPPPPNLSEENGYAFSLLVQSDDSLYLGGTEQPVVGTAIHPGNFVVYRLNPAGTPDTNFGVNGRLETTFNTSGYYDSAVTSLASLSDGNIIAGGEMEVGTAPLTSTNERFAATAFDNHGMPQLTFGANGQIVSNRIGAGAQVIPISDTRLLAVGATGGGMCLTSFYTTPVVYVQSDGNVSTEISVPGYGTTGNFVVHRGGDLSSPLTVPFTLTGTAVAGVDYTDPSTSVTIPAGADSALIPVTGIEDHLLEGNENVALQLNPLAGYVDVSAGIAQITIKDNQTTDRFESNNTMATATNFGNTGKRLEQKLTIGPGDVDYFRFIAPGAGRVLAHIDFENALGNLKLDVLNSAGTVVGTSDGAGDSEEFSLDASASATYYVRISGSSGAQSPEYSLLVANLPRVTTATFDPSTAQRLKFTFTADVSATVDIQDLQVVNLDTQAFVDTSAWSLAKQSSIATFSRTVVLPDGNYRATLLAAGISDANTNKLAADSSIDFFVFASDANHDRTVNGNDLYIFSQNWLTSGKTFSQGDFNYDGTVDARDLGIVATHWYQTLAAPSSAPPVAPPLTSPIDSGTTLPTPIIQPTGPNPAQPTQEQPKTTYLSDLTPTSVVNGYGQYEKDRSNGEAGAHDGHAITLNGKKYDKGLGVHAGSTQIYSLNGQYSQFLADIGVDDEVGSKGSVVFQVYLDNVKVYDSKTMTGSSATKSINLDVTGKKQLKLVVTDAGNGKAFDHADWAAARLLTAQASASAGVSAAPTGVTTKSKDLITTVNV